MKLTNIIIGERVRKDMGDIAALAESIKRHGLLHPVVVKSDGVLIAGHRRLEAVRALGWDDIPVTVIDVEDLLSAERDENGERKDFSRTEAVAIGALIEQQERPKAVEAMRAGGRKRAAQIKGIGEIPAPPARGAVREIVAAAVGMSGQTYARAKRVVAAAEKDPKTFGDLPSKMDETGDVSGAHREMERRKGGNGKAHRHPVFKKMHYRKPNQEVQRAIWALDGICDVLLKIDPAELDKSKTREWSASLKKAASSILKAAKRIA